MIDNLSGEENVVGSDDYYQLIDLCNRLVGKFNSKTRIDNCDMLEITHVLINLGQYYPGKTINDHGEENVS
jgi:hypothetical protein